MVSSTRGPGGGYKLKSDAEQISVSDIILAVDENCSMNACSDAEADGCNGDVQCLTHDLWEELSAEIKTFLDGITIAEVMASEAVQEVSIRQDNKTQAA